MTSKCKNQGKKKICSVKVYGAPCTVMHDLALERKEQTLRSRFAQSRAYESRLTCQHFISN